MASNDDLVNQALAQQEAQLRDLEKPLWSEVAGSESEVRATVEAIPSWELIASGYKEAADHLVERVAQRRGAWIGHSFAFPICYAYRHYLELTLKRFLCTQGGLPKESLRRKHDLRKLWRTVRGYLVYRYRNADEEARGENQLRWTATDPRRLAALDARINEFATVDTGSFAFRYPLDSRWEQPVLERSPNSPVGRWINLARLQAVMTAIAEELEGHVLANEMYWESLAEMQSENSP